MSLLVDLQLVPNRILEVVKARILANRARLGAQLAKVKGPTRPRVQRQRFNASATAYRRPEPSAQDDLMDYCAFELTDIRRAGDGFLTDIRTYVSENYYRHLFTWLPIEQRHPTLAAMENPGWTITRSTTGNKCTYIKAETTLLSHDQSVGALYVVQANIGFVDRAPSYMRIRLSAKSANLLRPFIFNMEGLNVILAEPETEPGPYPDIYRDLSFYADNDKVSQLVKVQLVENNPPVFTFYYPKGGGGGFFVEFSKVGTSGPGLPDNYMNCSVEVAISPTLAGLAF